MTEPEAELLSRKIKTVGSVNKLGSETLAAGGGVVVWVSGRLVGTTCGDPDAWTLAGCVTLGMMGGPVPTAGGTGGGGGGGGPVLMPGCTGVAPA